jgi:hypothetical protein
MVVVLKSQTLAKPVRRHYFCSINSYDVRNKYVHTTDRPNWTASPWVGRNLQRYLCELLHRKYLFIIWTLTVISF